MMNMFFVKSYLKSIFEVAMYKDACGVVYKLKVNLLSYWLTITSSRF